MADDCIIKEDHEINEIQHNDKENISLNGNNFEIQILGNSNNTQGNGCICVIGGNIGDKRTVNLDLVHLKVL